jgi:hypothetical protein
LPGCTEADDEVLAVLCAEHLSEQQSARLNVKRTAWDPGQEVTLAWRFHQKLSNIYRARRNMAGRSWQR